MKQTLITHACYSVREKATAYSLVTGKAAAGSRESGEARRALWRERESDSAARRQSVFWPQAPSDRNKIVDL